MIFKAECFLFYISLPKEYTLWCTCYMAYTCTVYSYGCFSLAEVHLFEILSLYHSNYQSMAVEELITPQMVTHRWQRETIRIDLSNPLSISI